MSTKSPSLFGMPMLWLLSKLQLLNYRQLLIPLQETCSYLYAHIFMFVNILKFCASEFCRFSHSLKVFQRVLCLRKLNSQTCHQFCFSLRKHDTRCRRPTLCHPNEKQKLRRPALGARRKRLKLMRKVCKHTFLILWPMYVQSNFVFLQITFHLRTYGVLHMSTHFVCWQFQCRKTPSTSWRRPTLVSPSLARGPSTNCSRRARVQKCTRTSTACWTRQTSVTITTNSTSFKCWRLEATSTAGTAGAEWWVSCVDLRQRRDIVLFLRCARMSAYVHTHGQLELLSSQLLFGYLKTLRFQIVFVIKKKTHHCTWLYSC